MYVRTFTRTRTLIEVGLVDKHKPVEKRKHLLAVMRVSVERLLLQDFLETVKDAGIILLTFTWKLKYHEREPCGQPHQWKSASERSSYPRLHHVLCPRPCEVFHIRLPPRTLALTYHIDFGFAHLERAQPPTLRSRPLDCPFP